MGEIGRQVGNRPIEMISCFAVIHDMNRSKPSRKRLLSWQKPREGIIHLHKFIYINQLLR